MMQVIMNDVWEVTSVEVIPEESLAYLLFTNTQTQESIFTSYNFSETPGKFLPGNREIPDLRPKEVMLLGKWLAKGAPR